MQLLELKTLNLFPKSLSKEASPINTSYVHIRALKARKKIKMYSNVPNYFECNCLFELLSKWLELNFDISSNRLILLLLKKKIFYPEQVLIKKQFYVALHDIIWYCNALFSPCLTFIKSIFFNHTIHIVKYFACKLKTISYFLTSLFQKKK